jgi:lipoic acid synthetase
MSEFKGIPVVGAESAARSGEKYRTPQGTLAIKDGIKASAHGEPLTVGRKPAWLRAPMPSGARFQDVRELVREHRLATVCEEAKCPNIGECWNAGTATLMLMGEVCTRACRFCAVDTGNPKGWLDAEEPANSARTVQLMGLKYVVLTSVNRDDLPDGGAAHFAACVREIKALNPQTAVEALTPDFHGVLADVETVVDSGLEVFAQNVETVRRLTHPVRDPRASYEQTIAVLAHAKRHRPAVLTKTSLMLGLGESDAEVLATMDDLRAIGVRDRRRHTHARPIPAADGQSPAGSALRRAGRVRMLSRGRSRARIPRVRGRTAGALQLPRRAGAGAQQRRAGRGRARAENVGSG